MARPARPARPARYAVPALLLAGALTLTACGGSSATDAAATSPASSGGSGALTGACPAKVVIQTDWEPESEHGALYQLLGSDYTVDTAKKAVRGSLVAKGVDTGVDIEIRLGGASITYQPVHSVMYQDTDIILGYGRVTEYMSALAKTPVTAVMATLEKSPYALYWDPATYPDVKTIADLKKHNVKIFMGSEATIWQDYLVAKGIVAKSQIDPSDAPKPATFIAAGGKVAEAGFASAEPYLFEVQAKEWHKPVALQLIHDTGYPEYFQALVVRTGDMPKQAACLKKLIPIVQQAEVDYVTAPAKTNALLAKLTQTYDDGWTYTVDQADWSIKKQKELGLVGNGKDGTLGSFDLARVQTLIDIVAANSPNSPSKVSGIKPDTLVTNQFIDPSIKLG